MTDLIFRDLDDVRIKFEATAWRIGSGAAEKVFARALTHEGRKGFTAVKRALRQQTSIKSGTISGAMRFTGAKQKALETRIVGRGREIPLKEFGAKQFTYGVRATVWGRSQRFPGAFMGPRPGQVAASLGGHVFHRTGTARLPIEKMFGPSIPKEMVKDQSREAFEAGVANILPRAMHELARVLAGY